MRVIGRIWLLAAGLGGVAMAAPLPDPAPQAPAPSPCAESPDYVPGMDVEGKAVPRADLGAEKVPLPGSLAVPLRQGRGPAPGQGGGPPRQPAYMALDGATLDRLVNPVPCRD